MSKQQMMPTPSGGPLPKLIGTAVVLALVAMVVKHPAGTAEWLQGLFGWATSVIDGLAAFFGQLTS